MILPRLLIPWLGFANRTNRAPDAAVEAAGGDRVGPGDGTTGEARYRERGAGGVVLYIKDMFLLEFPVSVSYGLRPVTSHHDFMPGLDPALKYTDAYDIIRVYRFLTISEFLVTRSQVIIKLPSGVSLRGEEILPNSLRTPRPTLFAGSHHDLDQAQFHHGQPKQAQ